MSQPSRRLQLPMPTAQLQWPRTQMWWFPLCWWDYAGVKLFRYFKCWTTHEYRYAAFGIGHEVVSGVTGRGGRVPPKTFHRENRNFYWEKLKSCRGKIGKKWLCPLLKNLPVTPLEVVWRRGSRTTLIKKMKSFCKSFGSKYIYIYMHISKFINLISHQNCLWLVVTLTFNKKTKTKNLA